MKQSHEGQFVLQCLNDRVFMKAYKSVRASLKTLYKLSIVLQAGCQSPWEAFKVFQQAISNLEAHIEDHDDEASPAVLFAIALVNNLKVRVPEVEAAALYIVDFRMLRVDSKEQTARFWPKHIVKATIRQHVATFAGSMCG